MDFPNWIKKKPTTDELLLAKRKNRFSPLQNPFSVPRFCTVPILYRASMDVLTRLRSNYLFNLYLADKVTANDPNFKLYSDIQRTINSLKSYIDKVKLDTKGNDGHYSSCVWRLNYKYGGPDTCLCCLIAFNEYNLNKQLTALYGRDVCGPYME